MRSVPDFLVQHRAILFDGKKGRFPKTLVGRRRCLHSNITIYPFPSALTAPLMFGPRFKRKC